MNRDIKKCLQCSTDYDAALSQPGNESRRKFCCRECKTAYHNAKHYNEHAEEIKMAVVSRRRGGKREGAGRKLGSGQGRTVTSFSISLTPELWDKLDAIRAEKSRSAFLADKLRKMRG